MVSNHICSCFALFSRCSMDPATIHLSQSSPSLSQFSFSFYLYHILKEPIPFQIQCKLIDQERSAVLPRQSIDCSMASVIDSSMHQKSPPMYRSMKRNDIYTVFRSSPVYVTRKLPSISPKEEIFHHPSKHFSSIEGRTWVFYFLFRYLLIHCINPLIFSRPCSLLSSTSARSSLSKKISTVLIILFNSLTLQWIPSFIFFRHHECLSLFLSSVYVCKTDIEVVRDRSNFI